MELTQETHAILICTHPPSLFVYLSLSSLSVSLCVCICTCIYLLCLSVYVSRSLSSFVCQSLSVTLCHSLSQSVFLSLVFRYKSVMTITSDSWQNRYRRPPEEKEKEDKASEEEAQLLSLISQEMQRSVSDFVYLCPVITWTAGQTSPFSMSRDRVSPEMVYFL